MPIETQYVCFTFDFAAFLSAVKTVKRRFQLRGVHNSVLRCYGHNRKIIQLERFIKFPSELKNEIAFQKKNIHVHRRGVYLFHIRLRVYRPAVYQLQRSLLSTYFPRHSSRLSPPLPSESKPGPCASYICLSPNTFRPN
jgi:hypothetical protein